MTRPGEPVKLLGIALVALLLLVGLYAGSLGGGFVSDDILYLESNPNLTLPFADALQRVLTRPYFANWTPLHHLLLLVEWQVFGMEPLGYRLVNLVLHLCVAASLGWLALRAGLSRRAAALAAAVALLHPVSVEVVAWVNQSKTLLATALSLLALERWLHHLVRPSRARAGAAVALAILAQLAKPAALPLPGVFAIAIATHGRGRWRELAWVALLGLVTVPNLLLNLLAQQIHGGIDSWYGGSPAATASILPWVGWRYLRSVVWPGELSLGVHPEPIAGALDPRLWLPMLGCLAVAAGLAVAVRANRRRGLAVGWFALGLLPVLQIVPMTIVYADRYLYYALPGALLLLAELADRALERSTGTGRTALAALLGGAILGGAAASAGQAKLWADPERLFARSAEAWPGGLTGWIGLGAERHRKEDFPGAAEAYQRALALREDGHTQHLLGRVRLRQGRLRLALWDFEEALRLYPTHHNAEWIRTMVARLRERGVTPREDRPPSEP